MLSNYSTLYISILLLLTLAGCLPSDQQSERAEHENRVNKPLLQYQAQFEQWKLTQDPTLIAEYEKFFESKVKQVPTLYELTLNSHPLSPECQQYRFSLPPRELWSNLIEPLQLIEQLQQEGYFAHYKIISVYRSREANLCVHGAKGSKHLNNFAVDFRTYDENKKHYADTQKIEQRLCQFWQKHGKRHAMGFGVYGKQRFHIDTQGYRTWGIGFKSVSSPCLQK